MSWPTQAFDMIKTIVSFLNENATLILVIITGVYVYFTYRMAKMMAMQVIADIVVTNKVLGSPFSENWFLVRLKNYPEQINKNSYFSFILLFDVSNRSSGSGSIDKPILELKFPENNFKCDIFPKTKEEEWKEVDTNTKQQIVTDLGGTIFLRGGESKKIELEYHLDGSNETLLKLIKEHFGEVIYSIKFKDNVGKRYLLRIEKVKGESEVFRK